MLKLSLCRPMLIDTHIQRIADKLPYSMEDLMDVLRCIKFIYKNDSGEFEFLDTSVKSISNDMDATKLSYGPDAIIEICNAHNVEIHPITEIEVPTLFYFENCNIIWDDVCYLFARVENRSSRLGKLLELNAPSIIIMNETRMLEEYLETLEHNNLYSWMGSEEPKHMQDSSGRIYRALRDGGYSMVDGFDREFLDEIDRRYEIESDSDFESED